MYLNYKIMLIGSLIFSNAYSVSYQLMPVTPQDAPEIVDFLWRMWVETFGHYYDLDWLREDAADYFSEGEVREECLDKNTFFMKLVSEEGEIIGCVQAFKKNETMVLSRFYLHSAIRGQGIGARLLKQAIEFCKPIKKARLIVDEHSKKSIAFYEKHGFKKSWC